MVDADGYRDWAGIAQAIKSAAAKAVKEGHTREDLSGQIMRARNDRFLSRVFADGEDSEWLLKGGTAMLARVPKTRSTKDLDLASTGTGDLDEAQAALEHAASRDLDDHLRFDLTAVRATGLGENQPGVQTRRLVFTCFDSKTGRKVGDVPIDLVVGPPPVGRVETRHPAGRLELSRPLAVAPYRLFPIPDQVAEKVCATMMSYAGQPSSRTKDLVDLVVIARTQTVDLRELQLAIASKRALSRIEPFNALTFPPGWERPYAQLAKTTAPVGEITSFKDATALAKQLVDPALDPVPVGEHTWVPGSGWQEGPPPAEVDDVERDETGGGLVHVQRHVRASGPVTEHVRSPRGSKDTT